MVVAGRRASAARPPELSGRESGVVGRYILRRLAQMVPVMLGVTLVVFFLLRLVPGDPAQVILGNRATDR